MNKDLIDEWERERRDFFGGEKEMNKLIKVGDYVRVLNDYELFKGKKDGVYKVVQIISTGLKILIDKDTKEAISVRYVEKVNKEKEMNRFHRMGGNKLKVSFCGHNTYVEYNGDRAISTCRDERFDKEKGIAIALCKIFGISYADIKNAIDNEMDINTIEVGQVVKVINNGQVYGSYIDWFEENNLRELKKYFKKDDQIKNGEICKVVGIGRHSGTHKLMYAIQDFDGCVHLIDKTGVEEIK